MSACICDEMAHEVDSCAAPLGFDGGADDTLLQLATKSTARGLRSNICMVNDGHLNKSYRRASQRLRPPRLGTCGCRCDREEFSEESLQRPQVAVAVRRNTTTYSLDLAGFGRKARDIGFLDLGLVASIPPTRL